MKALIVLAFLVGAVVSATIDDNEIGVGDMNSGNSEHLFTNITKSTDDKAVVEIRNEKGDLLGESDFFLYEGFQIDKPADKEVCLIKPSSDNGTCFEEKPVATKIADEIRDLCEGREVNLLNPISCDVNTEENGLPEGYSPNGLSAKRGWINCHWTRIYSTCCAEYKWCCSYWIFCRKCGCKRYGSCTDWIWKCSWSG